MKTHIKYIKKSFKKHLDETGLTYFQHMKRAIHLFYHISIAWFSIIIHAVFPFLLTKTASNQISYIKEEFFE